MNISESEKKDVLSIKKNFDAIGKSIVANTKKSVRLSKIFLDAFFDKNGFFREYAVIQYEDGAVQPWNAVGTSLLGILEDVPARLLNGDYNQESAYIVYKQDSVPLSGGKGGKKQ